MDHLILVVDDDEEDFILLASRIRQCQQSVHFQYAPSAQVAMDALAEGLHPDLIIVDAQMPLMDGYELLNWLMHAPRWRHIPVVMWTGFITESEVTRYYQAGANSFMLKESAYQDLEAFCRYWFKLVQMPQRVVDAH